MKEQLRMECRMIPPAKERENGVYHFILNRQQELCSSAKKTYT